MAQALQRVEVTLRSFYVFNSVYGKQEGEEANKILYYFPRDNELVTKINDIGLSEAIIAFAGSFVASDNCKALHTQKTTQLFFQPEPSYWMVLAINVPKECGEAVVEHRGSEVHDRIYRAVLEQSYSTYRLLTGSFQMAVESDGGVDLLRSQLESFFDRYLQSLNLSACDIMSITRSIQYLPLNKSLFLRAHNFINMTCATFPIINEAIFLYNEQIVCSGKIDPLDLFCLHEYIVAQILAPVMQTEPGSSPSERYRNGAFIRGPDRNERRECEGSSKAPLVFLGRGIPLQSYYLVVYRALGVTLCLLIDGHTEPRNEFYTELHTYICDQLLAIARDIEETLTKQLRNGSRTNALINAALGATVADNTSPKYLFINEQSLKHLSNIHVNRRRPTITHGIPMNIFNVIADLGSDEAAQQPNTAVAAPMGEVLVKTTNDFWIVKRRCNWRQYYVIIFNNKATLLDVTHQANRIFEEELTDDVFFDK